MKVIKILNVTDVHNIHQKVEFRQLQFDEDLMTSIGVVLMNYGDRLVQVTCVNGEFTGYKGELPPRDGIPLCPLGHPLFEVTKAPRLALIEEE